MMSALIWPYRPLTPVTESLEWRTDVLRTKSTEQRIALRTAPRRTLSYSHHLTGPQYAAARAMVRAAQGDAGFIVPDWTRTTAIGALSSGSSVDIDFAIGEEFYFEKAVLFESLEKYEVVDVIRDSGGVTADVVVNDYSAAKIMPAFSGDTEAFDASRSAGDIRLSVSFILTESYDVEFSSYATYRGLDVMPSCPIIAAESFAESLLYITNRFESGVGNPSWLRLRDVPENTFEMRWHKFTQTDVDDLIRWLHSLRGRQRAFWMSSWGSDLEVADAISGTTLPAYTAQQAKAAPFFIEVVERDGTKSYRRVTAAAAGSPVNGRAVTNYTLDSTLSVAKADVSRISILTCTRLNADRIELEHNARGGVVVKVPCIEVPEP